MKKSHYHVINEAVEFAKQKEGRYVGNFLNAVLRRYVKEILSGIKKDAAYASIDGVYEFISKTENLPIIKRISIGYSFPEWLVKRWFYRYGEEETIKLCSHMNNTPYFTVRVNEKREKVKNIITYFEKKGLNIKKARFIENSFYVDKLIPIFESHFFKENIVFVQDEVSQFAVLAVDPKRNEKILDACCGVGTKTTFIKELEESAIIFSVDNDLRRLKKNPNKMHLIKANILNTPFKAGVFDKILLDAPCSSIGIIKKHPEIKWRLKEKDIERQGKNQLSMLKSLWPSLKKQGSLIYSVCSFEPEETSTLIEEFKKTHKFIIEKPLPLLFNNEYFISLPHRTDIDGFFIVRLQKI